ncbi:MAG: aldo/keto reductase [Candidatus Helarchaeota archaeon]|nr:aldo/keto reductase [Candidatus Helarchaeota archaeon]
MNSTYTLNNGVKIPVLGLGTYQATKIKMIEDAIRRALDVGYRLIDTARMYGNESEVGNAVKKSGIPREEIFITTKVWFTDFGHDAAIKSFNKSLKELDMEYVDLLLIHWPVGGQLLETWKAFEKLFIEEKCRAIGVSNFKISHLKEFLEKSSIIPTLNQVEFHPFLYQEELLNYCRENRIQLEAYSPLTQGRKLNDEDLTKIANKYSKSVAQILIRWCIQHQVVPIPKSSNPERIKQNASIFDFSISPEDMKALDALNQNLRIAWYPPGY